MSISNVQSAGQPASLAHGANPHDQLTSGDLAIGVVIGRICQSFDLFVFGLGCVLAFPEVFFPFASHMDGVFYSFVLFALAFVARPLGSMFFVVLQRQFGIAAKLTIALFLLGMATAGTAFLPGYSTLGWAAIAALSVLRFVQGFALGGSWNGLASLAALKAPKDKRGWYAMLPQLADPIGFILAAALFAYIWAALTPQEFIEWGWRYPFFAAFAINIVSLFASLRMVVAPRYAEQLKERDLEPTSMRQLMREQGRNVGLGTFAPLASYALFHLVTIFALSWALLYTQQSVTSFLLVQVVGAFVAMPCMIISGKVANRFGRRTTLGVGGVLIAVYSGWTALLLSGGVVNSYLFVIVGYALLGFTHAQAAGAVSANFPPEFRYSGAMITSDFGWLIGAGFAPLVALSLAIYAGVPYVGLYLLTGAVGTLAALWFSRQSGLPND
ncbi:MULTISPECIES: MFS transporter [Rhodanobacter]|uniref:MFS transporter n=1 Tax=Rhodanobacter TaxID=75309 RepID=UPI001CE0D99B|nr:MFS transporter [Rhodanobacter sp. 7MK24]